MNSFLPNITKENIIFMMKRNGYSFLGRGQDSAELSFIRPLGRSGYPRFHLFIRFDKGKEALFNLHLDQKKPVYSGSTAHSADYEGWRLEEEMTRIKDSLIEDEK